MAQTRQAVRFACPGLSGQAEPDATLLQGVQAAADARDGDTETRLGETVFARHLPVIDAAVRAAFRQRGLVTAYFPGCDNLLEKYREVASNDVRTAYYLKWRRQRGHAEPTIPPRIRHLADRFDPRQRPCVGFLLWHDFANRMLDWLDHRAEPPDVLYFTNAHDIRMQLGRSAALPDGLGDCTGGAGANFDELFDRAPASRVKAGILVLASPWFEVPDADVTPREWECAIGPDELRRRLAQLRARKRPFTKRIGELDQDILAAEHAFDACQWLLARPAVRLFKPKDKAARWQDRQRRVTRIMDDARRELEKLGGERAGQVDACCVTPAELARTLQITEPEALEALQQLSEWLEPD